jgi:hypothetical protein
MARPYSKVESKKFKIVAPVNSDQKKMTVALALKYYNGNEADAIRDSIRRNWNKREHGTENPDEVEASS